jgi:putative hemolysin
MEPHLVRAAPYLIPALIALNAVFVTAEFSLVTLRRLPNDASSRRSVTRVDELVLFAQIGSTLATLALGYIAASFVWYTAPLGPMAYLPAWLDREVVAVVMLVLVAMGHVVLGEQIPRLLGVQRAEWIARTFVQPIFGRLSAPARLITWPLAWSTHRLAQAMGLRPGTGLEGLVHTPEEIQRLVAQSQAQGVVEEDEQEMIESVFQFSTTVAREVMTPRTDVIAVPVESTLDDVLAAVLGEEHSRLPVYEGTLDTIIGVLLVKDLLPILAIPELREQFELRRVMREPYFVPDTKPVDDILNEFRTKNVHLAVVLDEFGGTYGIMTLEDVIEEIVGEIHDEHDIAEPDFTVTPEGDVLIDGGALIHAVNERFELALPVEDFDTIGGYTFGALGRVPVAGDEVELAAGAVRWRLRVETVEERRIARLRLMRDQPSEPFLLADGGPS